MSRQAISGQRHILRALAQWPKDTVRPQIQFQDIIAKRFESPTTTSSSSSPTTTSSSSSSSASSTTPKSFTEAAAGTTTTPPPSATLARQLSEQDLLLQANALYSLLNDRYKRKYPLQHGLLSPRSKPTHFTDLVRELEEGPKRSMFERLLVRMKGLVRYQ
ncbi:cytochrome b pre-mRNA-processing protein 6 [Microdochium nivale]|nr:cytochrome b pre-mRNA-processing protein 6 [Microdochium nivale]